MLEACEKNWIAVFSALLTPTIAIFGTIIACLQWQINERRLRHELFNRRIELFDRISHYIADVLCHGNVGQGEEAQFLRNTRNAFFIFDKNIEGYVDKIYKQSVELQTLCNLENSLTGDVLKSNLSKQGNIKGWFKEELNGIRPQFQKYLSL